MKKAFYFLIIVSSSAAAQNSFFDQANNFFSTYVKEGAVDYDAITQDRSKLDALVNKIASYDLTGADKITKKAFMINAYNILAVKGIVDHYPVKSPFDIKDFFDAKHFTVAGEKMSLNILEKERLYPMTQDPRLHFVLVCAAVSCPKLADFAYVPSTLDRQLEQKTKQVLNDDEFIRVSGKKVKVSELFNWYANDFKSSGKSIIDYINYYRDTPLPSNKYGYYTYDWSLNK
ncbi:MAG: DUF547 domain-containing protein [Bacteroidota bacterium]